MTFKRADHVELLEQYRDPGDEQFTWIVIGDEEKGRVDIMPVDIALNIKPIYTVKTEWIRPAPPKPPPGAARPRGPR